MLWLLFCNQAWAAATCELQSEQLERLQPVTVSKVYDGDTVLLADGRKVRLIGVNTPEIGREGRADEPLATKARGFVKQRSSQTVWLQVGEQRRDKYGRVLGHLFSADGRNLTAELLSQGLGFIVAIPPNVSFQQCYFAAQKQAEHNDLGVWRHSYHRLRSVADKEDLKGGFGRYWGKVQRIFINNKVIWIDFYGDVSLRVSREHADHLKGDVLNQILQAVDNHQEQRLPHLVFSGWLMDRTQWGSKMAARVAAGKRKRWQMNISHRHHWRWADSQ